MAQATTKKERKWALKFNYSAGSFVYAGEKRLYGYGSAKYLDKAALFNSEQDALHDMMRAYKDRMAAGDTYPVPVPVDVVTETKPGSVREAVPREVADGFAVKRLLASDMQRYFGGLLCHVGVTSISARPNLNPTTVFASSYEAYEAIAKIGRHWGNLSSSYTVVPVVRKPSETVVTITEVSRCDCL